MSDTRNTTRATKRRLACMVEAAVQGAVGADAWAAMSAAEQTAAARVYSGDCAQHVRNIILAAMSAAGSAFLKDKLEESLADFHAIERMSTEPRTPSR
eukprot:5462918-Pleurochrysis_carterae.AAC.1